jgi:hypothetical protein
VRKFSNLISKNSEIKFLLHKEQQLEYGSTQVSTEGG